MNWTMNENSLFAVLLRSSWWISFAIAGTITAVAIALLPEKYRIFGAVTGLPFLGIGCIAAWKQFQAPSTARIDRTLAAVRAMSWVEFSRAIDTAYRRQGYAVGALEGTAADFEITREGRTALVSCKRWKVARTGVEPLTALHAMKEARNAHECIYVTAGEVTDHARAFAVKHAIKLVGGPELARLLPGEGRSRKTVDSR
jgi:restriction system protein